MDDAWKKIIKLSLPLIILFTGQLLSANYYIKPSLQELSSNDNRVPSNKDLHSLDDERKKIHMIHIAQVHNLPFNAEPMPKFVDRVIQSQLKVAETIRKYPDSPILVEGLYEDLTINQIQENLIKKAAKMIFPKGLQFNNAQALNSLQREFLYENGAPFTMLYLEEISSLYKTIHKEASEVIDREILSGRYDKIFNAREKETIECVKETAATQRHNNPILVIFGGAHNFEPFCEKENFNCEVIETYNFKSLQPQTSLEIPQKESYSVQNTALKNSIKHSDSQSLKQPDKLINLNKQLKEYPKDIKSRLNRASLFTQLGRFSDAIADYEYVIGEYPANVHAANKLEELKSYHKG